MPLDSEFLRGYLIGNVSPRSRRRSESMRGTGLLSLRKPIPCGKAHTSPHRRTIASRIVTPDEIFPLIMQGTTIQVEPFSKIQRIVL